MAKSPAFLFYPNDWIGGTLGMTFEQKGAYIELLMLQFNRGHMTKHMMGQTVGQVLDEIIDKFKKDENGRYYNERLDKEQIKRKTYVQSRFNNKEGRNQYTKSTDGHMTSDMEYIYIIHNDIVYNLIKQTILDLKILNGEQNKFTMVVIEMMKIWKELKPDYYITDVVDYPALLQIAYEICREKGWKEADVVDIKEKDCLSEWKKLSKFIVTHSFFVKFDLPGIIDKRNWHKIKNAISVERSERAQQKLSKQPAITLK